MSSFLDSARKWRRESPNQLWAGAVGVILAGVSIWVGLQARSVRTRLASKNAEWQQAAVSLATVQQQFKAPDSKESATLAGEAAHLGALGVPPSERVSLMEYLARLAEESSLADVRVNIRQGTDSVFIPSRAIGAEPITPAAYSVLLDFTGSFAGVVQFVSTLPPSVAVSRLEAAGSGGHPAYHVVLSVYELPDGSTGG